jgi:hypothetical protein
MLANVVAKVVTSVVANVVDIVVVISHSSLYNLVTMIVADNDLLVCKIECCYSCLHALTDATNLCNLNGVDVYGDLCNHMIDYSDANTGYPSDGNDDPNVDIFRDGNLCRAIPSSFSCSYLHACCTCLFCDNKASYSFEDSC